MSESEPINPSKKNRVRKLIAATALTASTLGVGVAVTANSDSETRASTTTKAPTTTEVPSTTTTTKKPKPTTTTTEAPTTITAKPPETTTTTEVPKQQWELDVEAMQARQVGDQIDFSTNDVQVKYSAKIFSGPSTQAAPVTKGGDGIRIIASPEIIKTPEGEMLCWESLAGQLNCSKDYPNMLKSNEQGEATPFLSAADLGLVSGVIDYIDEDGKYYANVENGGHNITKDGAKIAQEVISSSAVL